MLDKFKENAEETHIRTLVTETKILDGGSHFDSWDWDAILHLVITLKVNPKRLDEVLKNTKVFRRILSFFRPLNQQFSEMPQAEVRLLF